ncbi:MAG: ATP-binding protein [Eubacteriales bacterium]
MDTRRFLLSGVSIYKDVMRDPIIADFTRLLGKDFTTAHEAAELYGSVFYALCESPFGGNLADYIYDKVLYAENLFTLESARGGYEQMPQWEIQAAANDLSALSQAAYTTSEEVKAHLAQLFPQYADLMDRLPDFQSQHKAFREEGNWGEKVFKFAQLCANNGYGRYSRYKAFYLDTDGCEPTLRPVLNPDNISLEDLKGYEVQRKMVTDNTLALLRGMKANNMLLYGDRGTGKSSTVKAVVNEYCGQGLRLVEVSKENLKYLGRVIDMLAGIPMKFIIFTDDLTFAEGDDSYTAMKAVLEGSANKLGDNMALYATTNRRHLITETFSSRTGDDIHLKDTLDEAASLADRFGITVTFSSPGRKGYLEIVQQLAEDRGLQVDPDELAAAANRWSAKRTSFSPRTARQFIDYVESQKAQGLDI